MRLLAVALLVVACAALELQVEMNVYSGTPDPVITVRGQEAEAILRLLAGQPQDTERPIPWFRMGYRGFTVTSDAGHRFAIYNDQVIERVLLMKFNAENSVNGATVEHVHGEIERVQGLKLAKTGQFLNQSNTAGCSPPVRGPDTATVYDPNRDCNGCFVSSCTQNNCYNYGNDVATNTFAQPGRGTGHKWDSNTCADMRAAAERDGLVWAGTTLPASEPPIGHYVCLLIWPSTNFHWVRLDSQPAGYWSHKPGQTPIRNVDNNGNKITDCSKADLSPWSQFCGYMTSRPSNVTIN